MLGALAEDFGSLRDEVRGYADDVRAFAAHFEADGVRFFALWIDGLAALRALCTCAVSYLEAVVTQVLR